MKSDLLFVNREIRKDGAGLENALRIPVTPVISED